MSDIALPDIASLSFERLSKIKLILESETKPRSNPKGLTSTLGSGALPRRPQPASKRSPKNLSQQNSFSKEPVTTPAQKYKLAQHIITSSLNILDSWKSKNDSASTASQKVIVEAASLSLRTLYKIRDQHSRDHLSTEKRHLSFVLKLLDVSMVDESIVELNRLIASICSALDNTIAHPQLASILLLKAGKQQVDESIANIVVLTQIALLKALSKFQANKQKPVSSKVCNVYHVYFSFETNWYF